jgi:hydrogenase expression/formation protein HypC
MLRWHFLPGAARQPRDAEAIMCLAIPMQLTDIDGPRGSVDIGGVSCEVRLDLVEAPRVGDYVLVHAGYAIQVLDEAEASETLALLAELGLEDALP